MIITVLDACVLYPPSLRDLFMWLATVAVYAPRWTDMIHDEWIRNVLKNDPGVNLPQLQRTRRLMDAINPRSLVSSYEFHIPTVNLPDPDDRHVLAAAIHSGATRIVTYNLSDFPAATLKIYGVRAVHPDIFLSALFDDDPDLFLQGVRKHRSSLKNPPKTPQEYFSTLRACGLRELALRLTAFSDTI